MRLTRWLVALSLVVVAMPPGQLVSAGTADGTTNAGTGYIGVGAGTDPIVHSGGRSLCTWTWFTRGQIVGLAPNQGPPLPPELRDEKSTVTIGEIEYRVYGVVCPDGSTIRFVDPNRPPNFEAAITDYAEDLIELPVPNVNPPAGAGSFVNLGMWLAVKKATYAPITASAGPFWMTVTPTPGTTTFEFGNGDDETCDVFGVPIMNLDTVDEGPCGYTYLEAGDFTVTVTMTWLLPYQSSGGDGALPPMDRVSNFDYTVREIQAVGVGGD